MRSHFRPAVTALMAVIFSLFSVGVAVAVSGGGYDSSQQDCTANADATNAGQKHAPANPEKGCHAFKVNVEGGNGTRYAEVGVDQLPQGYPSTPGLFGVGVPGSPNFPHSGCVAVNTNGTGGGTGKGCGTGKGLGGTSNFDIYNLQHLQLTPSTGMPDAKQLMAAAGDGLEVYLGADDNLDAGEHDGVDGNYGTQHSVNGPSDGGAVRAHVTPKNASTTPSASNPFPVAGAQFGSCADGFCESATTQRYTVYKGDPHAKTSRDVANYQGKAWDPYNCSSGDPKSEQACHDAQHKNMDSYRNGEVGTVYAEPGVQVYEDPDPQGSPIDPLYEGGATPMPMLYPIPGFYLGTCGLIFGGGPLFTLPAGTPMVNSAGQLVIPTAC
jgi:hypothetical protein